MKKQYFKNLETLREKIDLYKDYSSDDIKKLLITRKKLQKQETMKSKLCSIEKLKQWKFVDGKIKHNSNQFFR